MSEKLERMQAQRSLNLMSKSSETYGKIVKGVADLVYESEWNSDKFHAVCNLVYQYGMERLEYGYWDGAIDQHLGMIDSRLDRLEAEQYAEAAAAAGQQDLLEPKPDHPHDVRCDGFVNTYDPNSNTGSSTSVGFGPREQPEDFDIYGNLRR